MLLILFQILQSKKSQKEFLTSYFLLSLYYDFASDYLNRMYDHNRICYPSGFSVCRYKMA